MKKIFAIITLLTYIFAATACSITINTSEDKQLEVPATTDQVVMIQTPTSDIEAITQEELELAKSIITYSSNLIAPSSVRVAEVRDAHRVVASILVRINAQNKIGGTATGWLIVNLKSGKVIELKDSRELNNTEPSSKYNINNVNRAIEAYFS